MNRESPQGDSDARTIKAQDSTNSDYLTNLDKAVRTDGAGAAPANVPAESETDSPELTAFQWNVILEIAGHYQQKGFYPYGLAIKRRLKDFYGTEINHGRLYPNLDQLVERGLVEKHERDRRTNEYALTPDAWALICAHRERVADVAPATNGGGA